MRYSLALVFCLSFLAVAKDTEALVNYDITPTEVSNLWTNSLDNLLAEHQDLTEEQEALIWEAIDFGTPENFAITEGWEAVRDIVTRLEASLTNDQSGALFSGMGSAQRLVSLTPYCNCWQDLLAETIDEDTRTEAATPCDGKGESDLSQTSLGAACNSGCVTWDRKNGICEATQ